MQGLLYNVLVAPLMNMYEALFHMAGGLGAGFRIVLFSVTISLLLLPVYNQMERRARAGTLRAPNRCRHDGRPDLAVSTPPSGSSLRDEPRGDER